MTEHAGAQLPEHEKYFQTLIENTSDIIVILNRDATPRYLSPAIERVLGYAPTEIIHKDPFALVHPDEIQKVRRAFHYGTLIKGTAPIIEFRLRRKDQAWGVFEVIGNNLLDDPAVRGLVVNLRDITVRKRAEEHLQESEKRLKSLSSQLLKAQERERLRIARELHDSIGQSLTGIKLRVENACALLRTDPAALKPATLETIVPTIQDTIEEVRKIVQDLRPSMLDILGVLATLRWSVRKFRSLSPHLHFKTRMHLREDDIPDPLKIVIYRVFQESMNNILKHSRATEVVLKMQRTKDAIIISVRDNGRGFNVEDPFGPHNAMAGFGIASMRERVEHSDGIFMIESACGRGTTVRACWPV